ncbi:Na-translocating system protein MpsC family protein [Planococcus sp. SE5232]|uniref:Na-translocating system protein MpsC family protein n=1 Tax=unclassified Planococcus (in: firmicutes) TaxID=2662419 RepID=UPI001CBE30EF|nr:Na-translocating system protein MpsC family protein [Planococcus sp. 4-30]
MVKEQEKTIEAIISRFSSTILRSHFGKGPKSVYVNIVHPFICIQIREFLSPMEKILLSKNEGTKVLELRDLLMEEIEQEFKINFWKEANLDIKELYADWNLDQKSGMILAVLKEGDIKKKPWPSEVDEKTLLEEIIKISEIGQKEPGSTELFWLGERTLLIRRIEIFTLLEKELINLGFSETLKLAKRPLEYKLFKQSTLEKILKRPIDDIYVDWNFNEDKGYAVLALQKK